MKIKAHFFKALVAIATLFGSNFAAQAQSLDSIQNTAPWFEGFDDWINELGAIKAEDFTFGIGAGVGTTPDYPGGDNYQTVALPLFQVRYKDSLTIDPLGIRVRVWRGGDWRLRVVVGLSESRNAKSTSPVSKLPDVDRGLNAGFVLEGRIAGPLAFRLNGRKEFAGGHGGMTISPSLGIVIRDKNDKYSIIPEVALTWGNSKYMDAFFSVTPTGSTASGLGIYNAGAGFREAALRLTTSYRFNEDWMAVGRIQAARLLGDAKNSSIVRQSGDSFQGLVGFGVMYTF